MTRKEERSKQGQANNKAKQHGTPKAVTFPKKNVLQYMYNVCVHVLPPSYSRCCHCRPEADDVRAMQQQLSSLHLVMEQTSTEYETQLLQMTNERDREQQERKGWATLLRETLRDTCTCTCTLYP